MEGKDKTLAYLKIANDNRNLEISLFWRNYFFYLISVLLINFAYIYLVGIYFQYTIFVLILGTVTAFVWTLTNRGSKYSIEAWEMKLKRYERPFILFRKNEQLKRDGVFGGARFSTIKLAIAFSDFLFLINLFLLLLDFYTNYLINYFPSLPTLSSPKIYFAIVAAFLVLTFVYIIVVLFNARINNYSFESIGGYTFLLEKRGKWFKFTKYKNDEDAIIRVERFRNIQDFEKNDKDLKVIEEIINRFPNISKL